MAELDGSRVAAVLAADAQVQGCICFAASLCAHLYETANAIHVDVHERIGLIDLVVIVGIEELASVVITRKLVLSLNR